MQVSTATEGTKSKLLVLKNRQKSDKLRFELRKHSLSQRNGKVVCRLRIQTKANSPLSKGTCQAAHDNFTLTLDPRSSFSMPVKADGKSPTTGI